VRGERCFAQLCAFRLRKRIFVGCGRRLRRSAALSREYLFVVEQQVHARGSDWTPATPRRFRHTLSVSGAALVGHVFSEKSQGRRSFWGGGFYRERLLRKAKCGTSLGSSGEERGENGKEALKKTFPFYLDSGCISARRPAGLT